MIIKKIKTTWNKFRRSWQNRSLNERLLHGFAMLDELQKKGLLTWMSKGKYLLLEEPFAISILATGKKGAKNVFTMIALWQNFFIFAEAAETLRMEAEIEAVRKAQKEHPSLTNEDIRCIRMNARNNMPELDPDKIDYIREFDLFVIRSSAPSAQDATEENGQLVALGHFDGKELQMAMYEDVKYNLMHGEDENH